MTDNEIPKKAVHDILTGETTITDMTEEELSDYYLQQQKIQEEEQKRQLDQAKKIEILNKLGLTEEELAIVLNVPVDPAIGSSAENNV